MTSEAGGDGKAYQGRRARRRNQLHEAGAPALAAGLDRSRPPIWRPRKAAKAKRPTITGIASGCARA